MNNYFAPAITLKLHPLAPPQPHRLPISLQLRNQRIPLLNNVMILLILAIRPRRLNDAVNLVNRAVKRLVGDEFTQVPAIEY